MAEAWAFRSLFATFSTTCTDFGHFAGHAPGAHLRPALMVFGELQKTVLDTKRTGTGTGTKEECSGLESFLERKM